MAKPIVKKEEPRKPISKKPIQLAEVRITASKKPAPKPVAKSSVKADTVKQPTVTAKKPTVRPDSVSVGYSKQTKMSVPDLKDMVKRQKLTTIDTSSVRKMKESSYGSNDLSDMADNFLARKKAGRLK